MAVNEFMLMLSNKLTDEKKLSESTVKSYIRCLYNLNDKKPFKSLTFLKKTDTIMEKLKDYADNTRKSILGCICSVLSFWKDKTYKKTYQFYFDQLKDSKTVEPKEMGKKTEREEKNWIEWADVEKKRDELIDKIMNYKNPKKLTMDQYNTILSYVLVSVYSLLPPRRNKDYQLMKVVSKWTSEMPKTENYLDFMGSDKPKRFVFNVYKTSKSYGEQIVDIPEKLADAIMIYIRYHPLRNTKRKSFIYDFLVNYNGEPFKQVNSITRILSKIFAPKKIGSSLLRHSYLSSKYDISEMSHTADLMGHSVTEQRKYLREDDSKESDKVISHSGSGKEDLASRLIITED